MQQTHVFDAYGTLFDLSAPVQELRDLDNAGAQRLADLWRARQLEMAWTGQMTGHFQRFWDITHAALDYAIDEVGNADFKQARPGLLAAYQNPRVYPEVRDALLRLADVGATTAILSNADDAMLCAAADATGLSGILDHLISIEGVATYKPHPLAYGYAADELGPSAGPVVLYSSNAWDVFGALSYGWSACWINRLGARFPYPVEQDVDQAPDLDAAILKMTAQLEGTA